MRTKEAIHHAGSAVALAARLNITPGAISQWGEYPPDARQLQLERVTLGALKAELGCLDRVLGLAAPVRASDLAATAALGV
ncbi:Cro/CI family transcriptional regulator [Variovorax sp. OAS795]|uniref:Cro/CI family transcriptional regulator n=1 Tax=Variovorax sp. OAS795 TaxID=3034231 RepID=UPI003395D717